MPWGKHRNKPMKEVPAAYFFWLWTQPGNQDRKDDPVIEYIKDNLRVLAAEHTDGDW